MFGMGTIFNTIAVLVGGTVGILLKKGMPERFRKIVFDATATAVFLIGLTGVMSGALVAAEDGSISSQYVLILLLSLASGAVVGELLRIDRGFDKIAEKIYNYPEVKNVYLMSGGYDLCVLIEGKTMKEVAYFVAQKLSTIEYITSTATHFVLKKYKDTGVVYGSADVDERGNFN